MRRIYLILTIFTLSCSRRPLVNELCDASLSTAVIPVAVDWSISGITPSESATDDDYVHRVSLRFFPVEGGAAFDRYLEGDIYKGEIELPRGKYNVVVFNESIYDKFWDDVFEFENVDDFDNFIALLLENEEDEGHASEAYKLASWSMRDFEVTQSMVNATRLEQGLTRLSESDTRMVSTLQDIVLRPLTCYINVSANIQYLSSAQYIACEVSGFANRVYMASGESHESQTLHNVELTEREYSDSQGKHGAISASKLAFTTSLDSQAEYKLKFEVTLTDGTKHTDTEPLEFDVAHQITRYATQDFDLSADFDLPEVSNGIDVDDWESDEVVTLN